MSSADPDFMLLRGPMSVEDSTGLHLDLATDRGWRRDDRARRRRLDVLSRAVRIGLPLAAATGAAAALATPAWQGWALAGVVVVTLLAKTAVTSRLDVASEVAQVKRVGAVLMALLLVATVTGIAPLDLSRQVFASGAACAGTLLLVSGLIGLKVAPRRVLLVGDRKAVADLIHQWDAHPSVQICGVCLDEESVLEDPTAVEETAVMGTVADVPVLAERHDIDQVVVAPGPTISAYDVRRLTWGLEHSRTGLAVAAEVHGATPHRIAPELIGRRLVLAVSTPRPGSVHRFVKALLDRTVGAALLALFAPVLLALALWVRLDSRGPAIFSQVRTGLGGRAFTMYKLRTMHVGAADQVDQLRAANDGAGLLFKLRNDPRVTRLGRWLRRSSLDELPQLLNVVKGDMSLIGPRPGLPEETQEYDEWIARRLRVKPGMTGLWQVSGRSNLGWDESVRLDLDYVDNQTLRDEFAIAYKTLRAVLQRDGAL